MEAEEQIEKEKGYCRTQWHFSVHYQDMSRRLEHEVKRLKRVLNAEKSFSSKMNAGFQRYHRIVQHLTGREMAHIQTMDVKGQLWRVSDHCKTRIELYVSKAYGEMRAAGLPLVIHCPTKCDSPHAPHWPRTRFPIPFTVRMVDKYQHVPHLRRIQSDLQK